MAGSDEILKQAGERGRQNGTPYAGALLPKEAHALVEEGTAKVVDVRSRAELDFVGRVPGSVEIEWKIYPEMRTNANFVEQLKQKVSPDTKLLFICRSGGRSHEAAMAAHQAGFESYNVLEGFEGDRDAAGHRNTVGGWRAAGLPWTQS